MTNENVINKQGGNQPLVSIIIPVFNGGKYLETAIQSVIQQTYGRVELIIIDAQSTDNTLDIIRTYEDFITCWVSEPDDGMYDAICKGFRLAKGDWLHWLNSDDLLMPWAANEVVHFSSKTGAQWVSGIPTWFDSVGNMTSVGSFFYTPRSLIRSGAFYGDVLGPMQQESIFFSAKLFNQLSAQELERFKCFKLAGDYWLWRCLAKHEDLDFLPNIIGGFRQTGENMSSVHMQEYFNEVYLTKPIGSWVRILRPLLRLTGLIYSLFLSRKWARLR